MTDRDFDFRRKSGLPAPAELRAGAAVLEREGLAAVARVLRLAAEAEEAVRTRLEAPNAPLFGDLTATLPALLRRLPGRVAVFYAPTVAALLSLLGTKRANGEPDAFADVATALCSPRPGKRKALSERERDREDLAYFRGLHEDLRALDAEARDLRWDRLKRETEALEHVLGEEDQRAELAPRRRSRDELLARLILRRSSRPVRPELLAALIWARGRKAKKIPFSKLAAWAWERTRAQRGRFEAGKVPAVAFNEADAKTALYNVRALEKRVSANEYGRDSGGKTLPLTTPPGPTMPPVETAATPRRTKGGNDGRKADEHGGPRRGAPREGGDRPKDAMGRKRPALHPEGEAGLVRPRRRAGLAREPEAAIDVRAGAEGRVTKGKKRRPPP